LIRLCAQVTTLALADAATLVTGSPAGATTAPAPATVWVDVRANSAWPVGKAVSIVDTYTGTRLRLGACRPGVACIVIREDRKLPRQWAAATYPGWPITKIKLNPTRRTSPYGQRLHTLVHELGHARGIHTHNERCSSVMYYSMRCPSGWIAPTTFTQAERRILRRH
jgi:hypothetical protein